MKLRILMTPKASQDLEDLYNYIAEHNSNAALNFFDATRKTIAQLTELPNLGNLYPTNNSRLNGLRKLRIKGFEKYLIFYQTNQDLLIILRILYASRDLSTIFELEE